MKVLTGLMMLLIVAFIFNATNNERKPIGHIDYDEAVEAFIMQHDAQIRMTPLG